MQQQQGEGGGDAGNMEAEAALVAALEGMQQDDEEEQDGDADLLNGDGNSYKSSNGNYTWCTTNFSTFSIFLPYLSRQ